MLRQRAIKGFVLAPLPVVAPVILLLSAPLIDAPPDSPIIFKMMMQVIAAGYLSTILVGLPIHIILHRMRQHSLSAYLIATLVAVVSVAGVYAGAELIFQHESDDNPFRFTMWSRQGVAATIGVAVAASICAATFWRVLVKQS